MKNVSIGWILFGALQVWPPAYGVMFRYSSMSGETFLFLCFATAAVIEIFVKKKRFCRKAQVFFPHGSSYYFNASGLVELMVINGLSAV